ncbi:hypothetical protein F2Q70_00036963 [Brassica cretica]|uniref:Uncharacterized protein n=1 Tax=Brassica cretica TaxID=69181 RepID=A0A8S9JTE4_BRACR|nr:hypothetical protein F2Q70_00036963 [Brassica cretica]
MVDEKELSQFQTMWSLKKQDLEVKERLSKMKLLDISIVMEFLLDDFADVVFSLDETDLLSTPP